MFGHFKKRSLSEQELSERAESCLGSLLIESGPSDFKTMVETGYLGFKLDSVYYLAHFDLIPSLHNDTICYVKLSDISILKNVRPAVLSDVEPRRHYIPQEILFASIEIAKSVKPWKENQRFDSQTAIQTRAGEESNRVRDPQTGKQETRNAAPTRKQESNSNPKAQNAGRCPNCGGRKRDGVCWSCGVR